MIAGGRRPCNRRLASTNSPSRFQSAGGAFRPACNGSIHAASTIHWLRDASYSSGLAFGSTFNTSHALALGRAMVKETKFFRKQAAKAERMARAVSDAEISERFLNMAKAYRSQADVLKAKKKSGKKRRSQQTSPVR
jgi:hypothetical protein